MKVSFPYMGTSHIAFKYFCELLGHEALVPPKPSKRTLSLGVQYAPEFACIPFKIILGSFIEAIENGAEMIITSGGDGPCRAGFYGHLQQRIVEDMGYDVPILVFDSVYKHPVDFLKKAHRVIAPNKISWLHFYKSFKLGFEKLKALDETEFLSHEIRPYEIEKGKTTKVFKECLEIIDKARSKEEILAAKDESSRLLRNIPQDRTRNPLKIGIVGEIYVVLEPFANLDIEVTLGEMGVQTHRSIYLTDWTNENTGQENKEHAILKAAEPYLTELVGGHGINSVGEVVLYAQKGFHGVVQLAPFTCIPEIVAKSILTRVSRDHGIPVLTVFLDEQTGKAGLQTRLEAFVDLLAQQRDKAKELAI